MDVRLTPRISDALPTYPENHFIHPAFAPCACYALHNAAEFGLDRAVEAVTLPHARRNIGPTPRDP